MVYLNYFDYISIMEAKPANKDLASWLSEQAYRACRIKEDLEILKNEEKILKSQYKVHLEKIETRRREIRERCRHYGVNKWVSTDGKCKYSICGICGKTVYEDDY